MTDEYIRKETFYIEKGTYKTDVKLPNGQTYTIKSKPIEQEEIVICCNGRDWKSYEERNI